MELGKARYEHLIFLVEISLVERDRAGQLHFSSLNREDGTGTFDIALLLPESPGMSVCTRQFYALIFMKIINSRIVQGVLV